MSRYFLCPLHSSIRMFWWEYDFLLTGVKPEDSSFVYAAFADLRGGFFAFLCLHVVFGLVKPIYKGGVGALVKPHLMEVIFEFVVAHNNTDFILPLPLSLLLVAGSENGLGTAIGTLAGRLAAILVQRNIGRVKDGPVKSQVIWLGNKPAEASDLDAIHEKGFVTFRLHIGKAGYFFTDDPTATLTTDDFRFINRLRVIDKAYRIAFATLTEYILDEVPLNADGTINAIFAKSIEGHVERELVQLMTTNVELSGDPQDNDDNGVVVQMDTTNNVAQDSTINVVLKVRPFGHARFFEVSLGFDINANH